jgi:hypothetical protein
MTLKRPPESDDGLDAASRQADRLNLSSLVSEETPSVGALDPVKSTSAKAASERSASIVTAKTSDRHTAKFVAPIANEFLGLPSKFRTAPEPANFVSPIAMDGFFT